VPVLKRSQDAQSRVKIVDELPHPMFGEFPFAIRKAIKAMIDGGIMIDRCCCLRSDISLVRIKATDDYSVQTLIAHEVHTAIETCR